MADDQHRTTGAEAASAEQNARKVTLVRRWRQRIRRWWRMDDVPYSFKWKW